MLGQRHRQWANIKIALFQRLVFAGPEIWYYEEKYTTNTKHWPNVAVISGQRLQCWPNNNDYSRFQSILLTVQITVFETK